MDEESIFRQEALEHHQRGRGPGELVRLPLWTTWAFWSLLTLFAGLLAATVLVTVSEDVEAIAVIDGDGRSVTALLPATYSDDVEAGDEMILSLPDVADPIALTIQSIGQAADFRSLEVPPSTRSVVAGQPQDTIPVHAELPASYLAGGAEATSITGTAVVHVQDRLLFEIVPGLKGLFSSNG
jgi:hypothetical protein